MNTKFYIYASGNRDDILNLSIELNWPGATIKPTRKHEQWTWFTPYEICSSDYPEDQLLAYIQTNRKTLLRAMKFRPTLEEFVVMIVSEVEPSKIPHGYSISYELMANLVEINASLEIDVTPKIPAFKDRKK